MAIRETEGVNNFFDRICTSGKRERVLCVFSGVVKDLTDRIEQSSTNDENSAQLVIFLKVVSIMIARNSALRDSKLGCVGR